MKLSEVASSKKQRSINKIVSSFKKEWPSAFKNGEYKITTEWKNDYQVFLEVHISKGLWHDEASYNHLINDGNSLINANDNVAKYSFEGGSDNSKYHYAVWLITYASNL